MKKPNYMPKISFILILTFLLFTLETCTAGNFTFTGVIDNSWAKSGNWSGGTGIPGLNDTVNFTSNVNNNLLLDSNRTVLRFVITTDSVNLNTKTLVALGSSLVSGGCVYNGTLDCRGSSSTFSGGSLDAELSVTGSILKFNGCRFLQNVTADFTGTAADTSLGGNYFGANVSITNSGGCQVLFNYTETTQVCESKAD